MLFVRLGQVGVNFLLHFERFLDNKMTQISLAKQDLFFKNSKNREIQERYDKERLLQWERYKSEVEKMDLDEKSKVLVLNKPKGIVKMGKNEKSKYDLLIAQADMNLRLKNHTISSMLCLLLLLPNIGQADEINNQFINDGILNNDGEGGIGELFNQFDGDNFENIENNQNIEQNNQNNEQNNLENLEQNNNNLNIVEIQNNHRYILFQKYANSYYLDLFPNNITIPYDINPTVIFTWHEPSIIKLKSIMLLFSFREIKPIYAQTVLNYLPTTSLQGYPTSLIATIIERLIIDYEAEIQPVLIQNLIKNKNFYQILLPKDEIFKIDEGFSHFLFKTKIEKRFFAYGINDGGVDPWRGVKRVYLESELIKWENMGEMLMKILKI
jgi:hypothetical protein